MFERRLKIFLAALIIFTIVLVLRAVQVQVIQRSVWREQAGRTMKRSETLETTRGRILDLRGRELAIDAPSIDACVDYRAILERPDEAWVRRQAINRLRARLGSEYRSTDSSGRQKMIADEIDCVKLDLRIMWERLGRISGLGADEIRAIRLAIVQRVEMRRRYVWYYNYVEAMQRYQDRDVSPWYRRWLIDDSAQTPELDQFELTVGEQLQPHAILRNISLDVNNELGKHLDQYPGLVLRPGTHRYYPYNEAACHLLGHLSRVDRKDLENDPNLGKDELRQYLPNDVIGRTGVESLCEQRLRGSRGRIDRLVGEKRILDTIEPVPGQDVRLSIDIELQREIQSLYRRVRVGLGEGAQNIHEMHGAAVVIDVKTGEVRALASYPDFNLNELDDRYRELAGDEINSPLLNRATQSQLEPGSTAKPMVGLGAITQGEVGLYEGIECTGYLKLHGHEYAEGRCWTASMYAAQLGKAGVAHHPFPIPHHGTHGNADGFLTFSEAIERSCNVYFETLGDRLGIEGLSFWFGQFGLGRPTGIGIAEASGRLPGDFNGPAWRRPATRWFAAIGQGQIWATPIQMANVAATIARDGQWIRPHLIADEQLKTADLVNLHLNPQALAEARLGMTRVVNGPAGTGRELHNDEILIAGKTGSAQAAPFSIKLRDADGKFILDEKGRPKRQYFTPSTPEHPNPQVPWYMGFGPEAHISHAWYIGFAPADKPQIAFAVLVEYGGSGGIAGASIARGVIEKCLALGYLSPGATVAMTRAISAFPN
jgi:penicillin-binding protein 2